MTARFNDVAAVYYGTKNYTSQNACGPRASSQREHGGPALTIRAGATNNERRGRLGRARGDGHDHLQKQGESVAGTLRTSTLWDKNRPGFVPDAFVSTGSDGQVAPTCP